MSAEKEEEGREGQGKMTPREIMNQLWALRAPVLTLFVVLVLLPLAVDDEKYVRCAYVVIVMAVLWLTETLPISATALLPILLFPLCEVLPAKKISKAYINDSSMLFMGGLILAVAVEEWKLHKRVAIGVLRIVGADPKFVMLGTMLPTWFLSMWMSNTATAAMMIPIAQAVARQLGYVKKEESRPNAMPPSIPSLSGERYRYIYHGNVTNNADTAGVENKVDVPPDLRANVDPPPEPSVTVEAPSSQQQLPASSSHGVTVAAPTETVKKEEGEEKKVRQRAGGGGGEGGGGEGGGGGGDEEAIDQSPEYLLMCRGLALSVAYGCNIGGISTLIGTPPNLVFKGQADDLFNERYKELGLEEQGAGITFANWMGMALPMSLIMLLLAWVLLMLLFLRRNMFKKIDPVRKEMVKGVIRDEWRALGPMTMAEIEVLCLFVFMAVMLVSRDPKTSPGWSVWFAKGYVSDSCTVMLIAVLLFTLPGKIPRVFGLRTPAHHNEPYYVPLLTWDNVHRKLPWGVIILLGGGFAMASACAESGLSDWLGQKLHSLGSLDAWVLNFILCLIVACATEVTSNTATSTLLMPIMAGIAENVGINPLYLMASAAMATSFAFMLPVATPPNAIVFSYGSLRVVDMAMAGLFMNCIAVLVLTLAVNTWGAAIFDFSRVPVIFDKKQNLTAVI